MLKGPMFGAVQGCASAFVAMPRVRANATPIHVLVILLISIPPVIRVP
jgi:hypothetical protein